MTFARFVLAPLAIAALPIAALAGDLRLPYSATTKPLAIKAHPVGSDTSHVLGVAAFDGTAEIDGETVVHAYGGQLELNDGAGTIRGYAHWSFDDGSSITARYEGIVYADADDQKVDFEANLIEIQGGGRFEGATGTGNFSGRRTAEVADGGDTEITGQLNLKLPD